MQVEKLFEFMRERHAIYQRRMQGKPKPWTKDKILQQYRFCNVYRELDTVTQWIDKNWRMPNRRDPYLWFAITLARFVNWPETLAVIGYPVPYNHLAVSKAMKKRSDRGEKVFTGAYLVRSREGEDKITYVTQTVLPPLWKNRDTVTHCIQESNSLATVHRRLTEFYGIGSFMAAQVLADIKYLEPLSKAEDWDSWAASGPGSRRGMVRVLNRPLKEAWRIPEREWLEKLQELHTEINKLTKKAVIPRLHAQDLQNCLCEFDKYERTRLGEGRPRSKYPGGA